MTEVDISSEQGRKFYAAIFSFNLEEVRRLVYVEKLDVNMVFINMNCWGASPDLVFAAREPTKRQTVLDVAQAPGSYYHHQEVYSIIKFFLEEGVDPNVPCHTVRERVTYCLESVIMAGELDMVILYLEYGANPLQPTDLANPDKKFGNVLELAKHYSTRSYPTNRVATRNHKVILHVLLEDLDKWT